MRQGRNVIGMKTILSGVAIVVSDISKVDSY